MQPQRDGTSILERMACWKVLQNLPALSANDVVSLALWPTTMVDFALAMDRTSGMLYNTLSRGNGRPYHPVRRAIAKQLGVPKEAVDHLIDTAASAPAARGPVKPPVLAGEPLPVPKWPEFDPERRTVRDGSNPIEQQAAARMLSQVAALPASEVLQWVIWPHTLAEIAAEMGRTPDVLYHMVGFQHGMVYRAEREKLATRLDVSTDAVDFLIEAPRARAETVQLKSAEVRLPAPSRTRRDHRTRGSEVQTTLTLD